MSQAESGPMPELVCRECGATNDPGASECWLCQRRDWQSDGASVPTKPIVFPGGDRTGRRIAVAIVAAAVAILGLGMIPDIWNNLGGLGTWLLFATLAIPVGLILWARIRRRPIRGESMTNQEVAAAASTIAAGVILVTWLVQAAGSELIGYIAAALAILAVPAGLYTRTRVRRRRKEGRPMTILQVAASAVFLTVLLPPLLLMSLAIALWLICLATGPPSFH
jgi:ribosomal protein L40E